MVTDDIRKALSTIQDLPLYCQSTGVALPKSKVYMDDRGDGRFVADVNDLHGAYGTFFAGAPALLKEAMTELERLATRVVELEAMLKSPGAPLEAPQPIDPFFWSSKP